MAQFLDNRGGGNALPPYLQGRTPHKGYLPQQRPVTQPIITPRPTVAPGEVRPAVQPRPLTPPAVPGAPGAVKPQAPAQTLYEYFKGDLERQRKAAMADTQTDASRRGVFYGSPLTTSQGDIQTEYLRGLGSLQAGILGNEQDLELRRLGLASGLLGQQGEAQAGGISPEVMQTIGSLLAPRRGPTITPAQVPQVPVNLRP